MRQGQQNRRGRGRGRKSQNSLSRNLESNGPDVKIRGTASHIAEKYAALARDALSSGDTVAGENYLQHAEHYNRIIMANQQAQQSDAANANANGSGAQRPRQNGADESGEKEAAAEAPAQDDKKPSGDEIAADDGVARTIARSVRSSGNGEATDGAEAEAGGESEQPSDEAVS